MLRYKTETRPGLVALYDIRPGNGAAPFLQPRSPSVNKKNPMGLIWKNRLDFDFEHPTQGEGSLWKILDLTYAQTFEHAKNI